MASELEDTINDLKNVDEKINDVSKQWVVFKHKYRSSKDPILRTEIKKKCAFEFYFTFLFNDFSTLFSNVSIFFCNLSDGKAGKKSQYQI